MPYEVRMPKLSDNMEEGTVIRWMIAVGDQVSRGDPIAEVETDKADVEIEAEGSGVVSDLTVPEGGSAPVGAVIAVLRGGREAIPSPGEAVSDPGEKAPDTGGGAAAVGGPAATESTEGVGASVAGAGRTAASAVPPVAASAVSTPVRVSPVARQLAKNRGVDLSNVTGSGPAGRIVKSDVEAAASAVARSSAAPVPEPAGGSAETRSQPTVAAQADHPADRQTVSRMRRTIAARMEKSKREIPHFYIRTSVDAGDLMKLREALRADDVVPGVTVTHLLVLAVARTLCAHPRLNAQWVDDSIQFVDEVNVGIVVALDDGLLVPVLKRADTLSLAQVVEGVRGLVDRSRRSAFRSDDLVGGTFSISNVGMLDVDELTPIINAPQAAILGVGAVRDRAMVRDGGLVAGKSMELTLACDHRVMHGVEAGRFLEDLKRALECPLSLAVERG